MTVNYLMGDELKPEEYEKAYAETEQYFITRDCMSVEILTVVLTGYPEQVKELISFDTYQWIINVKLNRLMIYENQPEEFIGLRTVIEKSLEENTAGRWQQLKKATGRYFSLFNMILVLLNCGIYLYTEIAGSSTDTGFLIEHGALSWRRVFEEHQYYRLLTYFFLHAGLSHLINNMLLQSFLGSLLERVAGKIKFLFIYIISGIGAGLVSAGVNYLKYKSLNVIDARNYTEIVSIGASGAVFGVVGALFYIVLRNRGRIENLGKQQMLFFIVLSLYGGFMSEGVDNAGHVGGLVTGLLAAILVYRKQKRRISE